MSADPAAPFCTDTAGGWLVAKLWWVLAPLIAAAMLAALCWAAIWLGERLDHAATPVAGVIRDQSTNYTNRSNKQSERIDANAQVQIRQGGLQGSGVRGQGSGNGEVNGNGEEAAAVAVQSQIANRKSAIFIVTAYCPCKKCCGPRACGITASGKRVRRGMCAADRSVPFGTRFIIPGYGVATVEDRGGAIRGRHIDVYFPTHREALAWGRRKISVRRAADRFPKSQLNLPGSPPTSADVRPGLRVDGSPPAVDAGWPRYASL